MALHHHLIIAVFFLIISTSSARPLNDFVLDDLAAAEHTLNLALPLDGGAATTSQEKDPQVMPCDHMVTIKNSHTSTLRAPRLAGKYGPMILSMLPRGPVPSSGPSKGTNDVKN